MPNINREKLLGTDLRLLDWDDGVDLALHSNGDLALTQGNDNIVQALLMRLRVHQGELEALGWPDYGSRLYELIGEPINSRTLTRLTALARAAVELDPRVSAVKGIQAQPLEGSIVRVSMEITLISSPNSLNLVFDQNLEAV